MCPPAAKTELDGFQIAKGILVSATLGGLGHRVRQPRPGVLTQSTHELEELPQLEMSQ